MRNIVTRGERVVLVAVEPTDVKPGAGEAYLSELSQIAETAGAEEVGRITQTGEIDPAHYLTMAQIDHARELIIETSADAIICDDELTAPQHSKLSELLGTKVLDRTMIILQIFEMHAHTEEGHAQVELAKLKYDLTHLTTPEGKGELQQRIDNMAHEIEKIRNKRATQRKERLEESVPIVALVGYTNAGKSTVMNALTGAGVLVEDKLFATLDTTARKVELPHLETTVIFLDTIGFINKLPHHLMDAFHSTLEDLQYVDILLHVVDSSSPTKQEQMDVVYKTLDDLQCTEAFKITVLNKTDIAKDYSGMRIDKKAYYTVPISAKTGFNIKELLVAIDNLSKAQRTPLKLIIPYDKAGITFQIYESCRIIKQESLKEGTYLEILATKQMAGKLSEYCK